MKCIIIDDGSTDNTNEVIKPILDGDTRFRSFNRENSYKKGLPANDNPAS